MTDQKLVEFWDALDDEQRKEFKAGIVTRISDAAGETGKMRLSGKISWAGYKRIMDEFVNQNPALRLYLQGRLR